MRYTYRNLGVSKYCARIAFRAIWYDKMTVFVEYGRDRDIDVPFLLNVTKHRPGESAPDLPPRDQVPKPRGISHYPLST